MHSLPVHMSARILTLAQNTDDGNFSVSLQKIEHMPLKG